MTLYYVPIEPLEERYTAQWYKYFTEEFRKEFDNIVVIDGKPLAQHIEVGAFLDINSTIAYKNSQMIEIASLFRERKIKDGDIFFFGDCEFWGIESLRLMADMNKIKIKITSFLHAGSYDPEDAFSIASHYQRFTELGWILSQDMIFVGSEFHKQMFLEKRAVPEIYDELNRKIVVTGNPIFKQDMPKFDITKKNKIIFANRFDYEKRPNLALDLIQIIKDKRPDVEIVVTTSRKEFTSNQQWLVDYIKVLAKRGVLEIKYNLSKHEYYKELASSKVSLFTSEQETFGYVCAESLYYNAIPIAPNKLSYPELLENDKRMLYDNLDEVQEKVFYALDNYMNVEHYLDKYYSSIEKIIQNMKGLE